MTMKNSILTDSKDVYKIFFHRANGNTSYKYYTVTYRSSQALSIVTCIALAILGIISFRRGGFSHVNTTSSGAAVSAKQNKSHLLETLKPALSENIDCLPIKPIRYRRYSICA
jgi:hypothetical protein